MACVGEVSTTTSFIQVYLFLRLQRGIDNKRIRNGTTERRTLRALVHVTLLQNGAYASTSALSMFVVAALGMSKRVFSPAIYQIVDNCLMLLACVIGLDFIAGWWLNSSLRANIADIVRTVVPNQLRVRRIH